MARLLFAGCFIGSRLTPPLANQQRDFIYRAGRLFTRSDVIPPLAGHRMKWFAKSTRAAKIPQEAKKLPASRDLVRSGQGGRPAPRDEIQVWGISPMRDQNSSHADRLECPAGNYQRCQYKPSHLFFIR